MTVLEKVPECESCTELAPVLDVTSEHQLYKGECSLTAEGFKFWNKKERTAGEAPERKLQYQLFREQGSQGRVVANGTELRLRRTESQIIFCRKKGTPRS